MDVVDAVQQAFGIEDQLRYETADAANARQRRSESPAGMEPTANTDSGNPEGGFVGVGDADTGPGRSSVSGPWCGG